MDARNAPSRTTAAEGGICRLWFRPAVGPTSSRRPWLRCGALFATGRLGRRSLVFCDRGRCQPWLFHTHRKADLFQSAYQPACTAIAVQAIVVAGAEFVIDCSVADDAIGNRQYPVRHGKRRLLAAASRRQAPKQGGEKAVLLALYSPRALGQNSSQVPIAFARVEPEYRLPALSLLPGHNPAQLAK